MINGLHQYSTESLIKELEKRELAKQEEIRLELIEHQEDFGLQCEAFAKLLIWFDKKTIDQMEKDAKRSGSEPFSFAGVPIRLFDPEQLREIEANRIDHILSRIGYSAKKHQDEAVDLFLQKMLSEAKKMWVYREMEKARDSFKKHT